jgi:glutamyl-tRNA synthetase
VILEGMRWLGLHHDEGPFYQMQRMDRYREVVKSMLDRGLAYPCYMSSAELDALRQQQMEAKQKPRYDGTWRPEPGKVLPPVPAGVQPVIRFKGPLGGSVVWEDKVKGRIEISNDELDDLVIARPAAGAPVEGSIAVGTPTYNFCVVVDDIDMKITHVIRGDDHVNNTPRQIHIFRALGQEPPVYAHLPTVLNELGEKMSKRHGAKPVTQYREEGYLADAVVNYLARLGWSHGDDEIFSREQLVQWFNLDHLGKSAAQFDETKLRWVNAQHMKSTPPEQLVPWLTEHLTQSGVVVPSNAPLAAMCTLFRDRCSTLVELAEWLHMYFAPVQAPPAELATHLTDEVRPALQALRSGLSETEWSQAAISAVFKPVLAEFKLKMPQLATPLRLLVCGRAQTPSADAVLALFTREQVLERLQGV